jgi:hypothetical protein
MIILNQKDEAKMKTYNNYMIIYIFTSFYFLNIQ